MIVKSDGYNNHLSPCGRRWREAPDEGSLSANSVERV
jgi:hypothetical protein